MGIQIVFSSIYPTIISIKLFKLVKYFQIKLPKFFLIQCRWNFKKFINLYFSSPRKDTMAKAIKLPILNLNTKVKDYKLWGEME
jgi:hypothetical protein